MRQWKTRIRIEEQRNGRKNLKERRRFNLALKGGSDSTIRKWLHETHNKPEILKGLVAKETTYMDESGVGPMYPKAGNARYHVETENGDVWWVKWLNQYQFDYYRYIENQFSDIREWNAIHAPYVLWTLNPSDNRYSIHLLCMPSYGHPVSKQDKAAAKQFAFETMHRLHTKEVYHGDLMGENKINWGNILVHEGEHRLIDFGARYATKVEDVDIISMIKQEQHNMEYLSKKPSSVEKPQNFAPATGKANEVFGHSTNRSLF